MTAAEYWVMRVLYHNGPQGATQLTLDIAMTLPARLAVNACIAAGTLALLPDNVIAEPVEVFDNETDARAHREQLARRHPTTDFRVILNADVPV